MYKVNPIFKLEELNINSLVYSMRNIHTVTRNDITDDINEIKECISISHIEGKQEVLMNRIVEIKQLLASLTGESVDGKKYNTMEINCIPQKNIDLSKLGIIHEVVLNSNVKNPPFSLLAINKLWPSVLTFVFSWHLHSSIKGLPKTLKKFENLNNQSSSECSQFRIRVVWKEVWTDCELVISPLNCVPLLGEVNFLRFLQSCISVKALDVYSQAYFDAKLDACHCLHHSDNFQQSQEYFTIIGEGLETNKWLTGDTPSIVDIAAWSAISNMKNPNLNQSLSRWFNDCDKFVNS